MLSFYNSQVIFLPALKKSLNELENLFLEDLYKIACKINTEDKELVLPEWANSYFLPNEIEVIDEQEKIEKEIIRYQNILQEKQNTLLEFKRRKQLFTASGNELENEIEKIFVELGFKIIEAEQNRDDLIVDYNDKIAVIEIKGVTGSAAEKNAAQLEKWVSNYYEANNIQPKGILIVNAFRDSELTKRGEVFPHQMLNYCTKREHCLISTIQLLGIYYDATANPSKKQELILSLYNTVGVYPNYKEWTNFISTAP